MSNIAGKAYAMNVLTPMSPWWTWVQNAIFMIARVTPQTLSGLLGLKLIHFARWVIIRRNQWPDLLALALILSPLAPPAWAGPKAEKPEKQCPHALGEFEEIRQDLDKAPTCAVAIELFSACSVGASSDVRIGGTALARCERDFLTRLNTAQKRSYQAEQQRCERKYSRREGTMYRSAEVFCRAQVAGKYARRFARTAGPARK
jgi:hypothetical protein